MTATEPARATTVFADTLPTLTTPRLVLRPFTASDARELQRLVGEREIADTTLNIPHPYVDGMAEVWIATHRSAFESHQTLTLAMERKDTRRFIGAIGMHFHLPNESAEIGYWVGRAYWGCGYATEAAREMLAYAFGVMQLNRVHSAHLTRNPASGRVMQKLGMTHEGRLRQHVKKWGVFEDIEKYAILRREYSPANG